LEVSSPGINRPLLRPRHYQRYLGQKVRIRTRTLQSGRRVFVGMLRDVGEKQVVVQDSDVGTIQIPWEDILKAVTEHDFLSLIGKKKNT
jgi:ribosome maturation factor RimP